MQQLIAISNPGLRQCPAANAGKLSLDNKCTRCGACGREGLGFRETLIIPAISDPVYGSFAASPLQ